MLEDQVAKAKQKGRGEWRRMYVGGIVNLGIGVVASMLAILTDGPALLALAGISAIIGLMLVLRAEFYTALAQSDD